MTQHPNYISNAFGSTHLNGFNHTNNSSGRRLSNVFVKNNAIYPRTVFLDVRPSLEKPLTEEEFLQSLKPKDAFSKRTDVIYDNVKPVLMVMRVMACLPLQINTSGYFSFRTVSHTMLYSMIMYMAVLAHVAWVLMQRIEIKQEGKSNGDTGSRFEEAVIAYLFIVYLLPIFMIPILWYETKKIVSVFNDWKKFEVRLKF